MFYYVPLEPTTGRYTEQLSRAETGWWERNLRKMNIKYERIEPAFDLLPGKPTNEVFDVVNRTEWAFFQSALLIRRIMRKEIGLGDIIWFDDFWHPGLEMVKYALDSLESDPSYVVPMLASFCHAQSIDKYDFMHKSKHWCRPIEQGYANIYDRVYVNSPMLAELYELAFNKPATVKGHMFSAEECGEVANCNYEEKEDMVIFASRLDSEKNPNSMMMVARSLKEASPETNFIICSGTQLRSNDPTIIPKLRQMESAGLVTIMENLTKQNYYRMLNKAKVVLLTSKQDWISYCLLEAVTFGCFPLVPNERSFPHALQRYPQSLYFNRNTYEIADSIIKVLKDKDLFHPSRRIQRFEAIVRDHNDTIPRIIKDLMGHDWAS